MVISGKELLVIEVHPVIFTGDLRDHAERGIASDLDLHSKSVVAIGSQVVMAYLNAVAALR